MRTGAVGVLVGVGPGNACTTPACSASAFPRPPPSPNVARNHVEVSDSTRSRRPQTFSCGSTPAWPKRMVKRTWKKFQCFARSTEQSGAGAREPMSLHRCFARTDWLETLVERDERGFLLTGPDLIRDGQRPKGWTLDRDPYLLETNVPGLFAVGDVRHGSVKRVASGVGEGSVAVQFIHQYLSKV